MVSREFSFGFNALGSKSTGSGSAGFGSAFGGGAGSGAGVAFFSIFFSATFAGATGAFGGSGHFFQRRRRSWHRRNHCHNRGRGGDWRDYRLSLIFFPQEKPSAEQYDRRADHSRQNKTIRRSRTRTASRHTGGQRAAPRRLPVWPEQPSGARRSLPWYRFAPVKGCSLQVRFAGSAQAGQILRQFLSGLIPVDGTFRQALHD